MTARLRWISGGKGVTFFDPMSTWSEQHLAGRGHPALGGVADLFVEVQALLVVVDELERHPHRVVSLQLALVEGVDLGGEIGGVALLDVVRPEPDQLEGLVHGPVEEHVVIGHVHVAVVVDPLPARPSSSRRRRERRRRSAAARSSVIGETPFVEVEPETSALVGVASTNDRSLHPTMFERREPRVKSDLRRLVKAKLTGESILCGSGLGVRRQCECCACGRSATYAADPTTGFSAS